MKKRTRNFITVFVALVIALPMLFAFACHKDAGGSKKLDPESSPLIIPVTVGDITGNFNPLVVSGKNDKDIVDRMMMTLVYHDKSGNIVYGKDQNTIALDVLQQTTDENGQVADNGQNSRFTFVLKNNLKWANGNDITLKDVLFSYHIYLDLMYDGETTMYSSDIVGLDEFRNGDADSVSGIKRVTTGVTIGGKTYESAVYNENGEFTGEGYEAFSIDVNGVDPKLMYDAESYIVSYEQFSPADNKAQFSWGDLDNGVLPNYGTTPRNQAFMKKITGDQAPRIPVASSAYQAADSNFVPTSTYGQFFANGIANLVRNDRFGENSDSSIIHKAIIKKVAYRNTPPANLYDEVKQGNVHWGVVDPKKEIIDALAQDQKMAQWASQWFGYGYMGINASFVPELEARQAIMMAANAQMTTNYYPATYASVVYRNLTGESWAYQNNKDYFESNKYYQYIPNDANGKVSQAEYQQVGDMLGLAGYKVVAPSAYPTMTFKTNGRGQAVGYDGIAGPNMVYNDNVDSAGTPTNDKILKQDFDILMSDMENHPAYAMLQNAAEILNALGQQVAVKGLANGMQLLQAGNQLGMWAASWSSSLDPDMTQVYHKDSKSSTMQNWGFGGDTAVPTDNDGNIVDNSGNRVYDDNGNQYDIKGNPQYLDDDETMPNPDWDKDHLRQPGDPISTGRKSINAASAIAPNADDVFFGQYKMVNDLADSIDLARTSLDQGQRSEVYKEALDELINIAVEMPTYQRKQICFWNSQILDESSFVPANESSGLINRLDRLWNVTFAK